MGRPRIYYEFEVPRSVVEIVKSLCADYERRELAIKHSNISGDVLMRYVELNAAIDKAFSSFSPEVKGWMLSDVASGRGYDYSQCTSLLGRKAYYLKNRKIIFDIALDLYLLPKK